MTDAGRQIQERLRDAIREKQRKDAQKPRFSLKGALEFAKIVGLCILVAVAYGIAQDQVTARVCVEYFTIGHMPVFRTESPTLLALGWGVIATWWVGLILGVPLAFVSRFGPRRKLSALDLLKPILILLLAMAAVSLLFGVLGYYRARAGHIWLSAPLAARVPTAKHSAYLADHWAHLAAYTTGFLGGIVLWFEAWRRRRLPVETAPQPLQLGGDVSRN